MAERLAMELRAPLYATTVSRLVADANRREGHPSVTFVQQLSPEGREHLLATWHRPHRAAVQAAVRAATRPVLHIAVHSFTPVLDGVERGMDMGLLYDPSRPAESRLAQRWKKALATDLRSLRVRRNAPYRGISDGLPTALRTKFGPERYAGFELELNQGSWVDGSWPDLWTLALIESIGMLASKS